MRGGRIPTPFRRRRLRWLRANVAVNIRKFSVLSRARDLLPGGNAVEAAGVRIALHPGSRNSGRRFCDARNGAANPGLDGGGFSANTAFICPRGQPGHDRGMPFWSKSDDAASASDPSSVHGLAARGVLEARHRSAVRNFGERQCADIFTKAFTNPEKWKHACEFVSVLSRSQTDSVVAADQVPLKPFMIPQQVALPTEYTCAPSVALFACPSTRAPARALPAVVVARVGGMVAGRKDPIGRYLGGVGAYVTAIRQGCLSTLVMMRKKGSGAGFSRRIGEPAVLSKPGCIQ